MPVTDMVRVPRGIVRKIEARLEEWLGSEARSAEEILQDLTEWHLLSDLRSALVPTVEYEDRRVGGNPAYIINGVRIGADLVDSVVARISSAVALGHTYVPFVMLEEFGGLPSRLEEWDILDFEYAGVKTVGLRPGRFYDIFLTMLKNRRGGL